MKMHEWYKWLLFILRLNYAGGFGTPYCFEASVSTKLCENVFNVILNRSRADVEFVRDSSCGVTLC